MPGRPWKPLKRLRQAAYLCCHPIGHFRCAAAIRKSRIAVSASTSLKYLGDHLALSLRPHQRRRALASHYTILRAVLRSSARRALPQGLSIWRKDVGSDSPLSITLERSTIAPMEGELQLRFSYKSNLCVLSFLLASGDVFGVGHSSVLFVGGVQGFMGGREEVREAARLNGEIAPTAMLLLAVQAIGRAFGVGEIIGIGEDDHVSLGYARSKVVFDYRRIWIEAGGVRRGFHYGIPFETPQKPLLETARSHRPRTRRKREAKHLLRLSIEQRVRQLISTPAIAGDQRAGPSVISHMSGAAPSRRGNMLVPNPALVISRLAPSQVAPQPNRPPYFDS
jgi:uncharacterized protein VirK/YbjX